MSILHFTAVRPHLPARAALSPALARSLFVGAVAVAAITGVLATDPDVAQLAEAGAGPDLTRLLRFMMLVKVALAAAAVAAVSWRLQRPASRVRLAGYALAGAAMAAGPGLIWGMAHVGLGALFLHAGLAASVVLLWRDPATCDALNAALKRRTARRAMRQPGVAATHRRASPKAG